MIIENKPGAGGRLAVEFVKNQPADGYTIMVAATGQMAIAAAIYPKLPYHPTRDFVPITMIASFPLILAGPANDTIKTVKDLVAYGKANPDKSNYATSSPAFTITIELFKLKTGMPARGGALQEQQRDDAERRRRQHLVRHRRRPAHDAAGAGRQDPRARGDRVGALLRAAERAEHGGGGLSGGEYRAVERGLRLGGHAARDRQEDRRRELRRAMADAGVREKLKAMAVNPGGGPGEEFRKRIDGDIKIVRRGRQGRELEIRAVGISSAHVAPGPVLARLYAALVYVSSLALIFLRRC